MAPACKAEKGVDNVGLKTLTVQLRHHAERNAIQAFYADLLNGARLPGAIAKRAVRGR